MPRLATLPSDLGVPRLLYDHRQPLDARRWPLTSATLALPKGGTDVDDTYVRGWRPGNRRLTHLWSCNGEAFPAECIKVTDKGAVGLVTLRLRKVWRLSNAMLIS